MATHRVLPRCAGSAARRISDLRSAPFLNGSLVGSCCLIDAGTATDDFINGALLDDTDNRRESEAQEAAMRTS